MVVAADLITTHFTEFEQVLFPVRAIDVDDTIRTEGRDDPPCPARFANRAVMLKPVCRAISRCQHLDPKTLEELPGPKLRQLQAGLDLVIDRLRVPAVQLLLHPEEDMKFVRQPHPGRRPTKEMEVVGENLPDLSVIGLDRTAIQPRYSERLQRNTL